MTTARERANAIRFLAADAVEAAQSGHPGMPMGMADIAEVLWNRFLKHYPSNPHWINRDRFILSNGHGSMLHYALLHLSGYALSIQDLKAFRQLHSKTPGHPEYGETPGVETTTGPLGQGLANAVGMAIAERLLAARFNQPNFSLIDHYTYVFCGDGCLMEGISHEVCSLAGTLGLGKLIVFWDNNGISIDGEVQPWFTENVEARFVSYGWQVISSVDGHDAQAIEAAIIQAQQETTRPTFIACKTKIGFGAPKLAGTAKTHGAPLGAEEIAATRQSLAWPYAPFEIPETLQKEWNAVERGQRLEEEWKKLWATYQKTFPDLSKEFETWLSATLPQNFQTICENFIAELQDKKLNVATRKASQLCLNALAPHHSRLIGGSADLTESNLTWWSGSEAIHKENFKGNYIYYGVREFGMSAIMNGLALSGWVPYGGTFLTFTDYARNAVRMAALMKCPNVFIYTHDSIGLGEDGPTHQPIEHASMLRLTPGLSVWRPCDAVETAVAWQMALQQSQQPFALLLSRQNLQTVERDASTLKNIACGGYILFETDKTPEIILIATGSEVMIALEAAKALTEKGKSVRVVSMPSCDHFDRQPEAYREKILPRHITKRIAIEAAAPDYWYKYVGLAGKVIGLNHYGASAPAKDLFSTFGFTSTHVLEVVNTL